MIHFTRLINRDRKKLKNKDRRSNLYSLPRQQKAPSCGRDVAQQGRCSGNTAFAWSGSTIGKFLGEKYHLSQNRIAPAYNGTFSGGRHRA
jgi:hypothetical protein